MLFILAREEKGRKMEQREVDGGREGGRDEKGRRGETLREKY